MMSKRKREKSTKKEQKNKNEEKTVKKAKLEEETQDTRSDFEKLLPIEMYLYLLEFLDKKSHLALRLSSRTMYNSVHHFYQGKVNNLSHKIVSHPSPLIQHKRLKAFSSHAANMLVSELHAIAEVKEVDDTHKIYSFFSPTLTQQVTIDTRPADLRVYIAPERYYWEVMKTLQSIADPIEICREVLQWYKENKEDKEDKESIYEPNKKGFGQTLFHYLVFTYDVAVLEMLKEVAKIPFFKEDQSKQSPLTCMLTGVFEEDTDSDVNDNNHILCLPPNDILEWVNEHQLLHSPDLKPVAEKLIHMYQFAAKGNSRCLEILVSLVFNDIRMETGSSDSNPQKCQECLEKIMKIKFTPGRLLIEEFKKHCTQYQEQAIAKTSTPGSRP